MAVDLEAVKIYCRIDGDGEDDLLLSLMDAAAEYLEGAGGPHIDTGVYGIERRIGSQCITSDVTEYFMSRIFFF